MSHNADRPEWISPDDALPPVEPPTAGFLLQLFVVPGVIVVVIVGVWFLFTYLARQGQDPKQYIEGLRRPGPSRWQVAANLADALRDERFESFKRDHEAAQQLADILEKEMAGDESGTPESVKLRMFLARALGEFYVSDGLDALLKAAREDSQVDVRRSAIEAIALLASNLSKAEPPAKLEHPDVIQTLRKLAADGEDLVRSATAFALGVLGTEDALAQLEIMLDDPYADVRYNAAVGLARHGNAKSIPILLEMLDPDEQAAVEVEEEESLRGYKRAMVMLNALRAVKHLAEVNPDVDHGPLVEAVGRLSKSDVDLQIAVQAKETLNTLTARARPAKQAQ